MDRTVPAGAALLEIGRRLIDDRLQGSRGSENYRFPGVGRVIYLNAMVGMIEGQFGCPADFPELLQATQSELAEWHRGAPKRKSQYFLDMANLVSYDLLPHARDDPRGQLKALTN